MAAAAADPRGRGRARSVLHGLSGPGSPRAGRTSGRSRGPRRRIAARSARLRTCAARAPRERRPPGRPCPARAPTCGTRVAIATVRLRFVGAGPEVCPGAAPDVAVFGRIRPGRAGAALSGIGRPRQGRGADPPSPSPRGCVPTHGDRPRPAGPASGVLLPGRRGGACHDRGPHLGAVAFPRRAVGPGGSLALCSGHSPSTRPDSRGGTVGKGRRSSAGAAPFPPSAEDTGKSLRNRERRARLRPACPPGPPRPRRGRRDGDGPGRQPSVDASVLSSGRWGRADGHLPARHLPHHPGRVRGSRCGSVKAGWTFRSRRPPATPRQPCRLRHIRPGGDFPSTFR
ncbi:hypothetical protein HRbin39_01359 [bacterium HR39]|nr:hypothetical protein HRbin39_01359 [bacterium HR39]